MPDVNDPRGRRQSGVISLATGATVVGLAVAASWYTGNWGSLLYTSPLILTDLVLALILLTTRPNPRASSALSPRRRRDPDKQADRGLSCGCLFVHASG